jgi:hypothetical protein
MKMFELIELCLRQDPEAGPVEAHAFLASDLKQATAPGSEQLQ